MNLLQHPGRIAVLFAAFAFFSLPSSAQTQYSLPALNCAAFTSSDSFGVAQQYARVLKGDVDPAGKVVVSLSSDSFDSFAVARGADQVIVPISSTSFTPASGGDFREVIRLRFFWAELKKTNTLQFFTSNNKLNVETLKQKLSSKKLDLDSVELFIDDLVVSTQVALTKAALESPTPLSPADQGYPRDAVVNQLSLLLRNRELVVGARDQYLASPSQERFAAFDSAIQSLFSQVTELQNSSSAYLAATKNLQNAILTYARDNPEEINNADATNLAKSVASPFEEVQFVADIVSPVVSFKEEFWTPRLAQVSPEGLDAVEASFSGIDSELSLLREAECVPVNECSAFNATCPGVAFAVTNLVLAPSNKDLWTDKESVELLEAKWNSFLNAVQSKNNTTASAYLGDVQGLARLILNAGVAQPEPETQPDYALALAAVAVLAVLFLFLKRKRSQEQSIETAGEPAGWPSSYGKRGP